MEKLFVSREQAEKLKQLGFKDKCLAWYNYNNLTIFLQDLLLDEYAGKEGRPLAPTYQQAFEYFRKNNLFGALLPIEVSVSNKTGIRYKWYITKLDDADFEILDTSPLGSLTYDEAQSICLDMLIDALNHYRNNG